MTYQEWIEEAERLEKLMRQAYDSGDESLGEMYEIKARAARSNAVYAREIDATESAEAK